MVADTLIHQAGALRASHFKDGQNGIAVDLGEPCGCANAHAFNQHVDDLNGLVVRDAQRV